MSGRSRRHYHLPMGMPGDDRAGHSPYHRHDYTHKRRDAYRSAKPAIANDLHVGIGNIIQHDGRNRKPDTPAD